MNKLGIEYVVVFGNDRYAIDRVLSAAKHRFDYLPDARRYADGYLNAYIFKVKYSRYSYGDVEYIQSVY